MALQDGTLCPLGEAMKRLVFLLTLVASIAMAHQGFVQQDSIPLPGKTRPFPPGTPPIPNAIPIPRDTFYPAHPDTTRPLRDSSRPDLIQRDDKDPSPSIERGIFRDTIPK